MMPLDALSAIAFDLPPNEFQLDTRYVSVLSLCVCVCVSMGCATAVLESHRNGIALFERPHACVMWATLTVNSASQKYMFISLCI